jgi:hypothetical protein
MRIEHIIDIDSKLVPDKWVFDEGETVEPLVNRGEEIGLLISKMVVGYELRLAYLLKHPPVIQEVIAVYELNIRTLASYCQNAALRLNHLLDTYYK